MKFYNFSSTSPFLRNFVQHLLKDFVKDGEFIKNFDPLYFSKITIYVPTQRAARSLREMLSLYCPLKSCILPRIFAIHNVDELQESLFYHLDVPILQKRISLYDSAFILTPLVQKWYESLSENSKSLFGSQNILVPNGIAESLYLSFKLENLIEEMIQRESKIEILEELSLSKDLTQWWQINHEFLKIILTQWPKILEERKALTKSQIYKILLSRQIKIWKKKPPKFPVIALGLKEPVEFISAISSLKEGAVYFQGLDLHLDEESWQALGVSQEEDPAIATHPQYSYYNLLKALKITRSNVQQIDTKEKNLSRELLLTSALRPASTTNKWILEKRSKFEKGLKNLTLIEAENEREEAAAIALSMREILEVKNKTVALVTSNRTLARRVSLELRRFGIIANESLGRPLRQSYEVIFIRLLLDCVFKSYDCVTFLSFFKHPLTKIGRSRFEVRKLIDFFEIYFLRKKNSFSHCYKEIDFVNFCQFIEEILPDFSVDFHSEHQQEIEDLKKFAKDVETILEPIKNFEKNKNYSLKKILEVTIKISESFALDQEKNCSHLYQTPGGESLLQFLKDLFETKEDLEISISNWPEIFDTLLQNRTLTPRPYGHPRVFIWGVGEFQLQTVDRVIFSNLNEGEMPQHFENDVFLSPQMRRMLNLISPEYKLGLQAFDFQMIMGMEEVILTRSLRIDENPSVASRFLQRLEAVIGEEFYQKLILKGQRYIALTKSVSKIKNISFAKRPVPTPPLEVRPKIFSVTEIETLRRDPYKIYAKKILKLYPLDPLQEDYNALMRGRLYHKILEEFAHQTHEISEDEKEYEKTFEEILERKIQDSNIPLEIGILWKYRLEAALEEYFSFEKNRHNYIKHTEISSDKIEVGKSGVYLQARADRIDIYKNCADILDIKTSENPSKSDALSLKSPQLVLEAALFLRKGFELIDNLTLKNLTYIRLLSDKCKIETLLNDADEIKKLSDSAWVKLESLFNSYKCVNKGYISHALPSSLNNFYSFDDQKLYDHLARVFEWKQISLKG